MIVARLNKNTFRCTQCKCCFYGEDNLRSDSYLSMNTEIPFRRELDWIILMPGPLDIKMNAAKAFMALNWDIFMRNIVKVLGFTGENLRSP